MSEVPLHICILWHMHQPFYKDRRTGKYLLPWVRLHALKDYLDMVDLLREFPRVHVTFNLVPSLLMQIEEYADGGATDPHLDLLRKSTAELTLEERVFLLREFFYVNWDTRVRPFPRYHDLLLKRGRFVSEAELVAVAKRFTGAELRDLQVWFQLAWCGDRLAESDEMIRSLIHKGRGFTEEEKVALTSHLEELVRHVIPAYRDAVGRGQIEISTTPSYHPILPLLCDTEIAKVGYPSLNLPQYRFRHPEDARAQIQKALDFCTDRFGQVPLGVWPSEGSVSPQVVEIMAELGVKWTATDEGILGRSLERIETHGRMVSAEELYQPYEMETPAGKINIVFRDRILSDLIGFTYSRWDPLVAAADFINRLRHIRQGLPPDGKKYGICIILDGENAWEFYSKNGLPFLRALYGSLQSDEMLVPSTISEFLREDPNRLKLPQLFPGSWINQNFNIWIGHPEDNLAWDFLTRARTLLESEAQKPERANDPQLAEAWEEIYVAEGSDWCWWYGDEHASAHDYIFDELFRLRLKHVYELMGEAPPPELDIPIKKTTAIKPEREAAWLIHPVLDGLVSNYYEWLPAGFVNLEKLHGAMHQTEPLLEGLYYGGSESELFCRLDFPMEPHSGNGRGNMYVGIWIEQPKRVRFMVRLGGGDGPPSIFLKSNHDQEWTPVEHHACAYGMSRILEMCIPYKEFDAAPGQVIHFAAIVEEKGHEVERWPRSGFFAYQLPDERFLDERWMI